MKRFIVVSFIVLSGCTTTRNANQTFYVNQSGSNGSNGSVSQPWRNISYAVERLQAGDSLCVGAGVWSDPLDVIDSQNHPVPSGESGRPITIGACGPEAVVIKPPSGMSGVKLTTTAPHHIIIQDMSFDGSLQPDRQDSPDGGAELLYTSGGAHHIIFRRLHVAHTMSHAVQFTLNNSTADFRTFIEVRDSVFSDVGNATGDSGHGGPGINNGYAIYSSTNSNTFYGNEFSDTRGIALVVYGPDNVVDSNRFHNTGTRGDSSYAVVFGSSSHPVPSLNNSFVNNLVYNNKSGGLNVYSNSSVDVLNNTFYTNGQFAVQAQFCSGGTAQNNIFRNNTADVVNHGCPFTASSNLPSGTDPKFVAPDSGDFRIVDQTSPAFDKGLLLDKVKYDFVGLIRPQSLHYDLGAYEIIPSDGGTNPEPPTTDSGLVRIPSISLTPQVVSATQGVLRHMVCNNPGDAAYIQLAGPTSPRWSIGIASGASIPLVGLNIEFTSFRVWASDDVGGTRASDQPISCNFSLSRR